MTRDELKEKIKAAARQVYGKPNRAIADYGETTSDEITKFPELKDILIKLMTEDFKVFVESIDWVAPKPTTFRINLKNGQKYGITNQYDLYTQKSEISCWDIMDDRIDTMIIDIEPEILKIVYKELQGDFTYSLMDDLNKKFVDENKDEYPILEEPGIATPEPMNELINPGGEIQYNDDTGLTTINHRMIYIGRLNSEQ
jgi:hypothetical protein